MAHMIMMENSVTGIKKKVPMGFSWTIFFFGVWVHLFRREVKHFFIMFFIYLITLGLVWFYDIFKGNKNYINRMIKKNYKVIK